MQKYGEYELPTHDVFAKAWWVVAEWAHPFWDNYMLIVFDLTTKRPDEEVRLFKSDVTHEVHVVSLDPKQEDFKKFPPKPLVPLNYAYQFKADSNDAAAERVLKLVTDIAGGLLSPDTDYRQVWDSMFVDGAACRDDDPVSKDIH